MSFLNPAFQANSPSTVPVIDGAIGIPLVFVVLVLPVAGIRALARSQRERLAARRFCLRE